jgi:hypothetical protein
VSQSQSGLDPEEQRDFRRLAGIMVPPSREHGVPGADDPVIFADIVRSLGRDEADVRRLLQELQTSGDRPFSALDDRKAEAVAMDLLGRGGRAAAAVGRSVLQCYYRDDRVIRALGLEPRAPFPNGHVVPAGDWSLLEAVRGRPRMWRDVDGTGA